MNDSPVIFLMGPTASGKTSLAIELAQSLPVEIISVDSALVYRGMDIGTAKPDLEIRARIPHHLIDICDPHESYSAARFRQDAFDLIVQIQSRDRVPLLVGGTMLYFRALQYGLSEMPQSDPAVKSRLEHEMGQLGNVVLHRRLQECDPISATRIHPNDPQRIIRALEVFELSGVPMSQWWAEQQKPQFPFPLSKFALLPPRPVLRERIADRFRVMLEQGLVDEVRHLKDSGLSAGLPSMRAVGYRQVWQYLDGELDYKTMLQKGIVASQQLAKRQVTWLRAEQELTLFDPADSTAMRDAYSNISKLCAKH